MDHDQAETEHGQADALAPIGHNSGNRVSPTAAGNAGSSLISVPVDQVLVWPAVQAQVDDLPAFELTEELGVLTTAGQRMPVIVRRLEDGRFEAIGRAHLVRVVEEHNRLVPNEPVDLAIHIMSLDDASAFRLAAQELEPGARSAPTHAAASSHRLRVTTAPSTIRH